MPRPKKQAPVANALVASAATLSRDTIARPGRQKGTKDWQAQAWYFLDSVGELRFGANWLGNALSRCRLTVVDDEGEGEAEITDGPAVDALGALFNGESGQSQMLATCGVHLTIPGETFLIGESETQGDVWMIASTEEVTVRGQQWMLDRGNGKEPIKDDTLVIRIWRSHPRKWIEADSPVRACLPILRELENLTKHVGATVDSRLAGAGILFVPSEMSFSAPVTVANPEPALDPFLQALTENMVTPIEDRGSASAIVPIVVKVPGDLIDKVQHITFDTPLDEHAQALRGEAIRRLALGMDMPPEVMLGQADSNHWSAWQIEESALKVHIEPCLELIADALTRKYLRPALQGLNDGQEISPTLRVGYDTSDLRLRPNHSVEAVQLYDRLELTGEALRRETGFDPGDAPDEKAIATMLLRKIATGTTTGDLTAAAVAALGVELTPQPSEVVDVGSEEGPQDVIPIDGGNPQEQREVPADPGQAAALVAASELLISRALERANNRLNRRGRTRKPVPADKLDQALAGAWDQVPRTAALLGLDVDWYTAQLDRYTRALLTEATEPEHRVLSRLLMQ